MSLSAKFKSIFCKKYGNDGFTTVPQKLCLIKHELDIKKSQFQKGMESCSIKSNFTSIFFYLKRSHEISME